MANTGEVVIVSGPPGSGKTTVSAALGAEAERGVHLESDWFFRSIQSGFVPPHLSDAHAQNTTVMDVATDAAAGYAEGGYTVVWDGIVGPWFLDRVARRLASRGIALRYLVLRPSRDSALDRVRSRDATSDVSGAEVMFDQFTDLGEFEANVIDTDASQETVLDRCRAALDDGRFLIQNDPWIDDRWPVSVKGVLGWDGGFVALRNRRGEWELPGGWLDATDADPESALQREMREELGIDVEVGEPIDSWIYDVEGKRVLILTYRCHAIRPAELAHSDEHIEVAQFTISELESQPMPSGYLRSIRSAIAGVTFDVLPEPD